MRQKEIKDQMIYVVTDQWRTQKIFMGGFIQ